MRLRMNDRGCKRQLFYDQRDGHGHRSGHMPIDHCNAWRQTFRRQPSGWRRIVSFLASRALVNSRNLVHFGSSATSRAMTVLAGTELFDDPLVFLPEDELRERIERLWALLGLP